MIRLNRSIRRTVEPAAYLGGACFFLLLFAFSSLVRAGEIRRIQAVYVPAPEPADISEEEAQEKKVAEEMDRHDLLYTGKVVVDQDDEMLIPPENVAKFEGEYYDIAKNPPRVEFGVIPATPRFFPESPDDHHRAMWANWGGSAYYPKNGKFYTSIGDNGSYDAHLYIVEYDPVSRAMTLSPEINQVLGRTNDMFSEGKIHGRLDFLDGAELWFCTYWSKYPEPKQADWGTGYEGGHVMTYHVETGEFVDYGVPMPRASWPGSRLDPKRGILYAVGYYSEFLAWDVDKRRPVWAGQPPDDMILANRVFLIDDLTGNVYGCNRHSSDPLKRLIKYDPRKNRFELLACHMPFDEMKGHYLVGQSRDEMRACTDHRGPGGWFYGVTSAGQLFRFDPDGERVEDLGTCWPGKQRYTASMELSPGGRYVYYLPGAHGRGNQDGSPLIQFDTETRKRKVLAFLSPYYQKKYGYTPSGSFSIKLDEKGERLFINFNGGFYRPEETVGENAKSLFSHNSIMLVHIPEIERAE